MAIYSKKLHLLLLFYKIVNIIVQYHKLNCQHIKPFFSHFYSFCVGKIHSEQKVPIILPHTAQDVTTFQNLRCSTFIFHGFMVFILFLRYRMFVLFLSPNVIYMKNKKGKHVFVLDKGFYTFY